MMASRKASRSISGTSTRARPSSFMEGGAAQKRYSILVFSVHATLTKFETEEFQDERVLYEISSFLDNMAFAGQTAEFILVPAEGEALVEGTGDLALEFPHAPLVCGGFDLVEFARVNFDLTHEVPDRGRAAVEPYY